MMQLHVPDQSQTKTQGPVVMSEIMRRLAWSQICSYQPMDGDSQITRFDDSAVRKFQRQINGEPSSRTAF